MEEISRQEKQVDEYVKAGNTDAAVKLLFDLIKENAEAKNFLKAEALREKLFEVDAMALTEIARSGEIIEEEKAAGMDQEHMDIWSELYKTLTKEEANALYYNLKEKNYDAGVTIIEEKKQNNRLYLINQGRLKMVFAAGENEMLLKDLDKGDVAGDDTFFGVNNCSTSLITLSSVNLHVLEEAVILNLEKDCPGLKSKLQDYCLKSEQIPDLLKRNNLDRRAHERYSLKKIVVFQFLNSSGGLIGKPFKGSISDISTGGLSFFIKTPKKETILMMLGRKLNLKFSLSRDESSGSESMNGTVVGACDHFFNDYSIHVIFEQNLAEKALDLLKPD